jgi:hypothetical protein
MLFVLFIFIKSYNMLRIDETNASKLFKMDFGNEARKSLLLEKNNQPLKKN